MSKKIVSGLVLTMLILGVLTLEFDIQPVGAGTITVPDDYPTIEEAIDDANTGDTILVRAGMYYEHVTISKSISLMGENKSNTIIDGGGTGTVFNVTANCVNVSGFTVQNCVIGICLYKCEGVNVEDNLVSNHAIEVGWGVSLESCNRVTVRNNCLLHNSNGILISNSSDNTFVGNNVTACGDLYGIMVGGSPNNTFTGNTLTQTDGIFLFFSGANILRNNVIYGSGDDLLVYGEELFDFIQDIDTTNIVSGGPVYYLTSQNDLLINPSIYPNIGYLALVNSTNITVENLKSRFCTILLAYTNNSQIVNNTLAYPIKWRYGHCIQLHYSSYNNLSNNRIRNWLFGMALHSSDSNEIIHNSFIDNQYQIQAQGYKNTWDSGYPSGGNYWSDHNPPDQNRDKIGDSPYFVDENNTDWYPLIYPYSFAPTYDVNWDGIVNILDVSTVANAFSCKPGDLNWNSLADMDINQTINILDITAIAIHFGETLNP